MSTAPNPVKRLVRLEVNGQPVQSAIEPRTVKDLVGDRLVALARRNETPMPHRRERGVIQARMPAGIPQLHVVRRPLGRDLLYLPPR